MIGVMARPWNNWYHCVGSTYGTWLPGDPRGFRTFRHREHVTGDYKKPPSAGMYAARWEQSKRKLKYPPVYFEREAREVVCRSMIERLQGDGVEVVALAVASNHCHLLARFPTMSVQQSQALSGAILKDGRDPAPRHYVGRARKHAAMVLSQQQMKVPGAVWAARPKCGPIDDRGHQCRVARYIHGHVEEDAAVWHLNHGFCFE